MKKSILKLQTILFAIILCATFIQCAGSSEKFDKNPKVRLAINKAKVEGVDKKIAIRVTKILYEKLKKIKGPYMIISREIDGISKSANRQCVTMINRIGQKYFITIKVVDGEIGALLANEIATVNEGDLDSAVEDIAEKLGERATIWELSK